MQIEIATVESQPFGQNSYVLWVPGRGDAVVVDPGFEPELVLELLADRGLTVAAILNTHGHVDHIAGNRAVKEAFPAAPLHIGVLDADMLLDPELNLSGPFGIPVTSPARDAVVNDDDVLDIAGMHFDCWHVPGHSPGHVVYFVAAATPPMLIGGDVLFRGSVGRTDFPGGSFPQLAAAIRAKLWVLPPDTVVYPGHGPVTTIGYEKQSNPFLAGNAG